MESLNKWEESEIPKFLLHKKQRYTIRKTKKVNPGGNEG